MPATPKLFRTLLPAAAMPSDPAHRPDWTGLGGLFARLLDSLAPEGHEDENGFHLCRAPEPRVGLVREPDWLGEHI